MARLDNCSDTGATPPVGDAAIAACAGKSGNRYDGTTNVLTQYTYTPAGRVASVTATSPQAASTDWTLSKPVTTMYAYDGAGRLCRVVQDAQGFTADKLACSGALPSGAASSTPIVNVSTTYTYTQEGQLESAKVPADPSVAGGIGTTSYSYDGAGHVLAQTDADGKRTTFTYDALGNKATETDSDTTGGATVAWLYDGAGRLCRRLVASSGNALGSTTSLTHPCTDTVSNTGIETRYTYDHAGNLATASDPTSGGETISAGHDNLSRPTSVTTSGGVVGSTATSYTYQDFATLNRTDPSGSYAFTLDAAGRESAMTNPLAVGASDPYTWAYGGAGDLLSLSVPTGTAGTNHLDTTGTYDQLGRLTGLSTSVTTGATHTVTTAGKAVYTYTYNAAGDQTGSTAAFATVSGDAANVGAWASGTSSYTYDPLGRISSAKIPAQTTTNTYGWNAQPQRTSLKTDTANTNSTFDAAGRPTLTTTNGTGTIQSSDGQGRLLAAPGQSYKWDNLGRLTETDDTVHVDIVGNPIVLATYAYDPLDRLVREVTTTATITYTYVGATSTIATITRSDGKNTRRVTDLHGVDLAETYTGQSMPTGPIYLGANGHGDVTWSADASGSIMSTVAYDPFGSTMKSVGVVATSAGWQSSLADSASSLYYVVARWYSPAQARFLSVDPVACSASNPSTLDRYAYGAGDPVNRADTNGRCATYAYVPEAATWCAANSPSSTATSTAAVSSAGKGHISQAAAAPAKGCVQNSVGQCVATIPAAPVSQAATTGAANNPASWAARSTERAQVLAPLAAASKIQMNIALANTTEGADFCVSYACVQATVGYNTASQVAQRQADGAKLAALFDAVAATADEENYCKAEAAYAQSDPRVQAARRAEEQARELGPISPYIDFGGLGGQSASYVLPDLTFGANWGDKQAQHMKDFNLDVRSAQDRLTFRQMIEDYVAKPDEVRSGGWSPRSPGGETDAWFVRQGEDLVVIHNDGEFWTILKSGADPNNPLYNAQWGRAIPVEPVVEVPAMDPDFPVELP